MASECESEGLETIDKTEYRNRMRKGRQGEVCKTDKYNWISFKSNVMRNHNDA
jgi:hypothetical protein